MDLHNRDHTVEELVGNHSRLVALVSDLRKLNNCELLKEQILAMEVARGEVLDAQTAAAEREVAAMSDEMDASNSTLYQATMLPTVFSLFSFFGFVRLRSRANYEHFRRIDRHSDQRKANRRNIHGRIL